VKKEVEIDRTKICKICEGVGSKVGAELTNCEHCDGRGKVLVNLGFIQAVAACEHCEGKGKVIANEEDNCEECNGEGTVSETKTITIPLDKGMRYGGMKIPGEGNEKRDSISGSVIVIVRPPAKDPSGMKLLREDDLFLLKDVNIVDALLGIKFVITHLNGKEIALQVPSGSIVSTGDLFKLKGQGMPKESEGEYGDLYIQFNVIFPTEISEDQKVNLINALGKPTEIPENFDNIHTLKIEKSAHDLHEEDEEEEEHEERQSACVQQ